MEARVGTLAVGTRIRTLLTGREGVVRAHSLLNVEESTVQFADRQTVTSIHSRVIVRVIEVVH